jgi:cephalosporin hydroxylase
MLAVHLCLIGQHQPLCVDLPYRDLDELIGEASRVRFIVGNMTEPDEAGVCRRVMIATGRIQCVIDAS